MKIRSKIYQLSLGLLDDVSRRSSSSKNPPKRTASREAFVILAPAVAERSRSHVWTPHVRMTTRIPADKQGLGKREKARARGSQQGRRSPRGKQNRISPREREQLGSQGPAVAGRNKGNSRCNTERQTVTPRRGFRQREGSKRATARSRCCVSTARRATKRRRGRKGSFLPALR